MASYDTRGGVNSTAHVPPGNFSIITDAVYRSAYPVEANVPYLRDIGIRTVVLLSIEALPAGVMKALKAAGDSSPYGGGGGNSNTSVITAGGGSATPATPLTSEPHAPPRHRSQAAHHGLFPPSAPGKDIRVVELADMCSWRTDYLNGSDDFSQKDVVRALDFAVDVQWHPVLFCCPTGELQTSVVAGCMRRYQSWSLSAIFDECELFAMLQRELRASVMAFIEAWRPEEHPISTTDIHQRNREWARERTYQRRKHRRMLRQQQQQNPQHGTAAHPTLGHHTRYHPLLSVTAGGGTSSVTRSIDQASDNSPSSSGEDSESHTDNNSTLSGSTYGGGANTSSTEQRSAMVVPELHQKPGGENLTEEGMILSGTGKRPPSAWRRRHVTGTTGEGGSMSPSVTGVPFTAREGEDGSPSPSHPARPPYGHGVTMSQDKFFCEVVYAEWFKEARRRNPACCVDVAKLSNSSSLHNDDDNDNDSVSSVETKEGRTSGSALKSEARKSTFPRSLKEATHGQVPVPHIRYAGVRNPPVLDDRSTFTKQSIVDDDDD